MLDLSESRQAGIAARLQQEEFAYFTTVRPDGRPHTVPVCFVWDGATILIFSPPDTTKIRNLRQNPQVSLALDSFGRDNTPVVVEGAAALVNEPDINFMMAANVAKYTPLAERVGVTFEHLAQIYTRPFASRQRESGRTSRTRYRRAA